MAQLTIADLKTYFENGDIPSQTDFANLIDTLAQGAIFITNATGAGTVTPTFDPGIIGQNVVTQIDTDIDAVTITVVWEGPNSLDDWQGSAQVKLGTGGTPVAITGISRLGSVGRFYTGSAVLNVTSSDDIIAELLDAGANVTKSHVVTGVRAAAGPEILTATFTGGYPGTQTELKAGDTFQITGTTDVDASHIEILNFEAFVASGEIDIVDGTTFTVTGTIADRGDTVQDQNFRIRARNTFGTFGSNFETSTVNDGVTSVKLNNIAPTVTFGTVTYPGGQGALKDSENATISMTTSDLDTINYTSGSSELSITNPTTDEATKTVTRIAGNYRVSGTNITATANRAANDNTTVVSALVKIAHVAHTITVTESAARLRSGSNEGTSVQGHTITITANQELLSAPTLNAAVGAGAFTGGGFTGGPSVWTRNLDVNDNDTKGTHAWGAMNSVNLANKAVTVITGDSDYILGGFVFRTVTVAALSRTRAIGTNVEDPAKLKCTNLSKGASGSLNFTYKALTVGVAPVLGDDEVDRFTIVDGGGLHDPNGNVWYNLDKANSDSNTTGTMQIELEETV